MRFSFISTKQVILAACRGKDFLSVEGVTPAGICFPVSAVVLVRASLVSPET
jgi:hypothetical protein